MVESKKQDDILSKREFEVLKLIAQGYSDISISRILNISPFTVKTHRQAILKKFQAKNCTEVVYKATKMNYI